MVRKKIENKISLKEEPPVKKKAKKTPIPDKPVPSGLFLEKEPVPSGLEKETVPSGIFLKKELPPVPVQEIPLYDTDIQGYVRRVGNIDFFLQRKEFPSFLEQIKNTDSPHPSVTVKKLEEKKSHKEYFESSSMGTTWTLKK